MSSNPTSTTLTTNLICSQRTGGPRPRDLRDVIGNNQKLAFGIEANKYLTWDLKQAAIYMGEFIIPKVKSTIDKNQDKFAAIFLMGENFEHVTMKTCTLFNQNRPCPQGTVHRDTNSISRGHFCTICWETLWVLAPHRVVTCPLTTCVFWEKMKISLD